MTTKGKAKRGAKASEIQKTFLVDFLQDRLYLANDKFPSPPGSLQKDKEWELLSVQLNALGGATKDAFKWRKYWKDLTISVRSRDNSIKEKCRVSGINGFLPMREQSEIDRKILSIITYDEIEQDPCFDNDVKDIEKVHITQNHNKPLIDVCKPEEEELIDDSQYDAEFYPSHFEAELSLSSNDVDKLKEAVPSSSTSTSKQKKRKRTFSTSTTDVAFNPSKNDSYFKFYMEIEQKKLKLEEKKIELMEENKRIQIEIKNSLDHLLQELHNKNIL